MTNLQYGWNVFRLQTRRLELFPKHWWITSSLDCDAQYNCIPTKGWTWMETLSDNFVTLLQVAKTRTTPLHSLSNGLVEPYNRMSLQTIRCFLKSKQQDWDWWLQKLARAIRTTPNMQSGISPKMKMFGGTAFQPPYVTLGTLKI